VNSVMQKKCPNRNERLESRSVKTLITSEKSLIMSLPLSSPFFLRSSVSIWFPPFPSSPPHLSVFRLHSSAMLTMWSTPTTQECRFKITDLCMVVPVDDSLNYSQRFPLCFHLHDFASLVAVQDELSKHYTVTCKIENPVTNNDIWILMRELPMRKFI